MATDTETRAKHVIGVRFRTAEPISYFDPGGLSAQVGQQVVVETTNGLDVGKVVLAPGALLHRDPMMVVRPTVRIATDEDLSQRERLVLREAEALVLAKAKPRILDLTMKFSRARFSLDERKVVLEFSSEERVELGELYRRLGEALKVRVELRPIGPRDTAKNIGGLGTCGLTLCCSTWLDKFESISVRMAKEQALPISSEGLAGQCGRLKCCLRFEYEQYRATNKLLPKVGERVLTAEGPARVVVGHPLKETVSVLLERRGENDFVRTVEYPFDQVERLPRDGDRRR